MSRLKPKWRLLAIVLALSAFLATFYVAYAGIVQWSREQPATLTTIVAVPLASSTMSLFRDEALSVPLTENDVLEFVEIAFEPPLAGFGGSSDTKTFFLRNDSSDISLSVLNVCCPGIFDPATGEFVTSWHVFGECCPEAPIPPGESQRIFIHLHSLQRAVAEAQFTVVIGAVGETTANGQGVSTISPQLQAVLDSAAQEEPGQ